MFSAWISVEEKVTEEVPEHSTVGLKVTCSGKETAAA
jgi:hypothetical protein